MFDEDNRFLFPRDVWASEDYGEDSLHLKKESLKRKAIKKGFPSAEPKSHKEGFKNLCLEEND